MFTIEHEFDATVITLIDEGEAPLHEDVVIESHDGGATISQMDPDTEEVLYIQLSMHQLKELSAALNLPEGVYRIRPTGKDQSS
ncbi:MAG: hypothetical protein H6900_15480 [Rhodobacter sp.]|uniref:hypothetical protein n=1 Tax=Pararhodobacter sp. TaxID=2127056 RepID=UPI001D73F38E|nr:hypothetical protein [Pararhodobacter sp.]MCB1345804.1 hypothetical protein [Paracoccaceae bacterium]MCC0074683.1 hypothetical protein [Rhodobacter sp.]HPD92544.1 hypothetical protein [Pararhodobacter sp.]